MITHKQNVQSGWKFPCHGKGVVNGTIVLFLASGIGYVVHSPHGSSYSVGPFDTGWNMKLFTPCTKGTSTTFTDE